MSVEIASSALSMPQSLDSLKATPPTMHRFVFELDNLEKWYAIMAEARTQFGKNWRCQPKVKRKLAPTWMRKTHSVWFEVPDPTFGTWTAVKLAVTVKEVPNK